MAVKFEKVRQIALALDGVEEGCSYGTPGFKVKGVLFLRLHQDLDALVVRVDLEQREDMIATDPETYFITDHYLNYPWILVRLARVRSDALPDLIQMAWREARGKQAAAGLGDISGAGVWYHFAHIELAGRLRSNRRQLVTSISVSRPARWQRAPLQSAALAAKKSRSIQP